MKIPHHVLWTNVVVNMHCMLIHVGLKILSQNGCLCSVQVESNILSLCIYTCGGLGYMVTQHWIP
jgi:hypothetical protein